MNLKNYYLTNLMRVLMVSTPLGGAFLIYFVATYYRQLGGEGLAAKEIFWISLGTVAASVTAILFIHEYLKKHSVDIKPGLSRFARRSYRQAGIVLLGGRKRCQIVLPNGWKVKDSPRYASQALIVDENSMLRMTLEFENDHWVIVVVPRFELRYNIDRDGVERIIYDNVVGDDILTTKKYQFADMMDEDQPRRAAHLEAVSWLRNRGIRLNEHRRNWERQLSVRAASNGETALWRQKRSTMGEEVYQCLV